MKKVRYVSVTLAKPTVQVIACDVDERLFLIVGFANAMHQRRANVSIELTARGVTEMPLFSDRVEHGSTSVDAKPVEFTAHGS